MRAGYSGGRVSSDARGAWRGCLRVGQWAGLFDGLVPDDAQSVDDCKVFRFRDLGRLSTPAACVSFDTGFVK
jgi:hypothetical protein